MLSEFQAGELRFDGLAASGESAAEAGARLAEALRGWVQAHASSRVVQLSVVPAVPEGASAAGGGSAYATLALVTYVDSALEAGTAARAVAAAVEEIHEAQVQAENASED